MTGFTPEDLAELDRDARARLGKPLGDCTLADLARLILANGADVIEGQSDIDRANAALDEVEACGCELAVPTLPDGSRDIGRARPVHTCGR